MCGNLLVENSFSKGPIAYYNTEGVSTSSALTQEWKGTESRYLGKSKAMLSACQIVVHSIITHKQKQKYVSQIAQYTLTCTFWT